MNTLVIKDQVHKSPQKYIFFEKKVETLFLLSTLKKKRKGARAWPRRWSLVSMGHWSPSLYFSLIASVEPHASLAINHTSLTPLLQETHTTTMAARSSLPSFCLHRIRSDGRRGAPPSIRASSTGAGNDGGRNEDVDGKEEEEEKEKEKKSEVGRKVMVVADGGGDEARTALQWALSHSVRPCDTVVLLDVVRSVSGGGKDCEFCSYGLINELPSFHI